MSSLALLAQGQPSPIVSIMPLILIGVVFYFLVFMPQRKRQKALKEMLEKLKPGDKVITSGGIYGIVSAVRENDDRIQLKIADQVKIEVSKNAIVAKQPQEG
jgi:preprotein translocase subunit YajC